MQNIFILIKNHITTTPRTSLFFCMAPVLLLASALSGIGFVLTSSIYLIIGTIIWIIWFLLLFMMAIPSTDKLLQKYQHRLNRFALIIFLILLSLGITQAVILPAISSGLINTEILGPDSDNIFKALEDSYAYNDATALTHQAIDNLLSGKNPYSEPNISKAILKYNGSYEKVTPLRLGRFSEMFPYPEPSDLDALWETAITEPEFAPVELESKFNYPAGSFLIPALLVITGINDLRIIYAIFIILSVIYTALQLPGQWRLLFIGALIISIEIINAIFCGETGGLVFSFLLVAWVLLPKRIWISAICLGIAVAVKQTAWFYAPYFLIYIYTMVSRRKVVAFIGIVAVLFLAMNLPFFILNPELWIQSIFAPMTEPMFPLGVGIVTIVTGELVNIQSSFPFAVIELSVMVISMIWYTRNCRRYPNTGPILAILPLFFAWRSLWPYFFYTNIIALAGILANEYGKNKKNLTKTFIHSKEKS